MHTLHSCRKCETFANFNILLFFFFRSQLILKVDSILSMALLELKQTEQSLIKIQPSCQRPRIFKVVVAHFIKNLKCQKILKKEPKYYVQARKFQISLLNKNIQIHHKDGPKKSMKFLFISILFGL